MNPLQTLMAINISWDEIFNDIGNMYSQHVAGDPILLALIIFFFFLILTAALGLGMLLGIIILIPAIFLVGQDLPYIQIIVAIVTGFLFGITLNKIFRR